MTDVTHDELTIDELARRTGMTVRNIRAHQSRGLLPPPEVRARTGYYGPEHVARIELIRELQSEGFNLESIRRLLDGAAGVGDEVLRFTRALREPFEDEEPQIVDAAELGERWRSDDPRLLQRAERLGFLRSLGDGRYEEISPRLSRAGTELVRLFLEQVWKPFDEAGRPEERWPEIREALERLRPLASEALLSVFQIAMGDAVERAFGREMERGARGRR